MRFGNDAHYCLLDLWSAYLTEPWCLLPSVYVCAPVCMHVHVLVLISGCLTYTYSCGCLDYGTTVGACLGEHLCPRTWCDVLTCHPQLRGVTLDSAHHFVHIIGNTELFHIFHPRLLFRKEIRFFFWHYLPLVTNGINCLWDSWEIMKC